MATTIGSPLFWISFLVIVLILLSLDLGIFHRKARVVSLKEALSWSAVWVALSLCFGAWIYHHSGPKYGMEFLAGYLIEYALSVDNVLVFIMIFSYFSVPAHLHHRVLFWGILGALIMRGTFIFVGAALIRAFHWILYVLGVFLVVTGLKIMRAGDTEVDPKKNPVVRLFQRIMPMSSSYESNGFVTREAGRFLATPLALVLLTVESTDLVFATDSIPAIFGVTRDPFIVYTSNICAILGLRSMYFLLAAAINRFAYLGRGVGLVLVFIGIKMLAEKYVEIPIGISLAIVAVTLGAAVLISLLAPPSSSGSSNPKPPLVRSESDRQ